MLRVLHVEGGANYYGGARQAAFLAEGLARRGHHNIMVCPRDSLTARRMAALPLQLHTLPLRGDADVMLVPQLIRVLRAEKPDILHLHSRRGPEIFGAIAGRLCGVPVVYSRRVDHREPRPVTALKYRLYDRVVAISACIAQVLRESGVPEQKIRVVRSAFTAEATTPNARDILCGGFGLPLDSFVIGVVAQLIERKGHVVLLNAVPKLLRELPQLQILLFGKGALEPRLREQIAAAGLGRVVHLAGYREDLPQLLPGLDLLVHPAYAEGLGVSLLQASSAGVPIIASRAGGIPEAVRDGVNGLLVPPRDVSALAEAIRTLAHDEPRRLAMGEAGRSMVAAEFSVDAMVEGNLRVYHELLASKGGT